MGWEKNKDKRRWKEGGKGRKDRRGKRKRMKDEKERKRERWTDENNKRWK